MFHWEHKRTGCSEKGEEYHRKLISDNKVTSSCKKQTVLI